MRRYLMMLLVVVPAVLLAACATEKMRPKQTVLDETLKAYAATIRWGKIEEAQAFIDPKVRVEHPPSALELARFKQVQVTAYNEQPPSPVSENEVRQVVEIGLVNINSQSARSVIDRQTWRYDEESKHWWLVTGLPDITRQQ